MKKFFVYIFMGVVMVACTKTNEETESAVVPGNTGGNTPSCDTVNMKYTANVLPIISANCYGCHGNGRATAGISLDTYDKLKVQVNNKNLMNVITHATGYPPMPYQKPKLADCDINKIKAWIDRGALNN
jgi:cytochrome c553